MIGPVGTELAGVDAGLEHKIACFVEGERSPLKMRAEAQRERS